METFNSTAHGDMNIAQQKQTWDGFMKFTIYTAGFIVVVLAILGVSLLHLPPRLH